MAEVKINPVLSAAQLWMLWELFNEPGLNVSGLATGLSIHLSTSSNMLDKLQLKGFVHRDRSHNDQRIVQLYLTEKGMELLAKAPRPAPGALTDVLSRLQDNALLELETGLDKFVAALKIINKEDGMLPISEKSYEK